jgi:hypothetical protein
VDSRKIIATGAGRQHLTAVRIHQYLFQTEELAGSKLAPGTVSRDLLKKWRLRRRTAEVPATRGVMIGWVTINDNLWSMNTGPSSSQGSARTNDKSQPLEISSW